MATEQEQETQDDQQADATADTTAEPESAEDTPQTTDDDAASSELPDLARELAVEQTGSTDESPIDMLKDVELDMKIELGRSKMLVDDVLKLGEGSIVEIDKLAGDPVDILVNERLVARGEVLVLNDNFCIRVSSIVIGKE